MAQSKQSGKPKVSKPAEKEPAKKAPKTAPKKK